jgi:hypothetical protein
MTAAWPGTLPQALQSDTFSEGVADGLLETQPDVGPPITRLRSATSVRSMIGTMLVTSAQIAILKTFVNTTLTGGALPFTFPDQLQAGTLLVKFPKGSLPKWTAAGGDNYTLSLSLLVLP